MTGRDTAERLALYLAHLHAVTGEDPIIEEVEPRDPSDGRVLSLGYRDVPGPGLLTGVTYGLSLSSPGGGWPVVMKWSSHFEAEICLGSVFRPGLLLRYAGFRLLILVVQLAMRSDLSKSRRCRAFSWGARRVIWGSSRSVWSRPNWG